MKKTPKKSTYTISWHHLLDWNYKTLPNYRCKADPLSILHCPLLFVKATRLETIR